MKMYCNSCHKATEHTKSRNYSIVIAILLLCLGIVPGIIYIVVKGKKYTCTQCGTVNLGK